MNQGIHYLDLLLWCMGPVSEVTALFSTQTHRMEAEDAALAVLRFASGAVGSVVASTAVFPGFAQRLEISGTGGTVVIEDGEVTRRSLTDDSAGSGLPGGAAAEVAGVAQGGRAAQGSGAAATPAGLEIASHAAQIRDLLNAIDEGREPSVTGEDGRAALEVVRAVYESARDGRTVKLPVMPHGQDNRS
jgi:UDP-N-acetyl-2-amino-2-deoxyglucuronate dehydrogenase